MSFYTHNDEAVEFVPAGDGHWRKVSASPMRGYGHSHTTLGDLALNLRDMHTYGHPAHPAHSPMWVAEDEEDVYSDVDEDGDEDVDEEDFEEYEEDYPVGYTHCHLGGGGHGEVPKGMIIDESWLSPEELEILRKHQKKSRLVQVATTAGGALVGFGLGGPLGGAVGGAGGSVIGEAISPTPNRQRTWGRTAKKAFWGAVGGGLSPVVFGGALAPWAATVGGGAAGYWG